MQQYENKKIRPITIRIIKEIQKLCSFLTINIPEQR